MIVFVQGEKYHNGWLLSCAYTVLLTALQNASFRAVRYGCGREDVPRTVEGAEKRRESVVDDTADYI